VNSQTSPEFYGWAWDFPIREDEDVEWRQTYAEEHKRWLANWCPLEEWMQ
jgi:hypothetical protein